MDKRRIGIRIQLSTVFAVGMALVAVVLVTLDFVQTRRYLLEFARNEMALAERAIHASAGRYFEPVASAAETLVAAGPEAFSADNGEESFFRIAERLLARYPQIFSIYGGFPDGTFVKAGHLTERIRLAAGIPKENALMALRTRVRSSPDPREPATITWRYRQSPSEPWQERTGHTDFDPRARPWYRAAKSHGGLHWSDVYQWSSGIPGITVSEALSDGEQGFGGAMGVDVRLSDLTEFLDSARVSPNSVAFIAREDGGLVAHSSFALDHDPAPDQSRPQSILSAGFKDGWPLEHALFAAVTPGEPAVVFDYQGEAILGVANRIAAVTEINTDAILFMAIPVKDFVGFAIRSNLATLAGATALIALLIGIGLRVARQIASPIERLARLASQVGKTGFHDAAPHPGSTIREIDDAGAAFNAMVVGLREREVMRDLFGKYVPERVVSDLIARGGALEPVAAECTILFTDIEGFTGLTERLGPAELVTVLNAYFTAASAVIEHHNGVITQFQGDAILAIFNIPIADPDHAAKAVRTGLDLLEQIERVEFGGQRIRIRVGIATGEVVAGNVGAEARLSYTVHGDAVNLAARLEAMNKELGTRILVSESTRAQCPEIGLEPVGTVSVRGQSKPALVYTAPAAECR